MKELSVLELFGGIGAIRKALININKEGVYPYNIVDYVENDKNAVKSYNALYDEKYKEKDIRKYSIDNVKVDILMHGSPCQDFSYTGLRKGGEEGSGTRSSLLFETIRIIEEMHNKPRWIIWENVEGVLSKKMQSSFFNYIEKLEALGYKSKYKVLNALDFSISQHRKRVFVISYLGSINPFSFSNLKTKRYKCIKKILEDDVSGAYIVKQHSILNYINNEKCSNKNFARKVNFITDYCYCISNKQTRMPNAGFVRLKEGKVRFLTERECLMLMGFDSEDYEKLAKIHKKRNNAMCSIIYKQAGNSIVVNILMEIMKEIYFWEYKNIS